MKNKVYLPAVAFAGFVSFMISFVWYTVLFRQAYLDGLGKTAAQLAQGPSTLEASVLQFAGNLLMAYVIAWLCAKTGATGRAQAIKLGVMVWLGLVVATIVPMYAFQAFSYTFAAINVGYPLVALLTVCAIVGGWKRRS